MIANLFDRASFAQAAYATFIGPADMTDALKRPAAGFTATQAARFANKYSLVTQFNDDATAGVGNGTSFSVSVFTESGTNKLTVALRGTTEIGDYLPTDSDIFIGGAGYDQIVAMQNWWLRETRLANTMVAQYAIQARAIRDTPPDGGIALTSGVDTINYLVPVAAVAATGRLIGALTESGNTVEVTGHSLGGHLAMAFQALNNAQTATVTTFNAPGFKASAINQQFFTTLGGSVPTGTKTTNVIADGVSGNDVSYRAIAGLHGRPGTMINVRIENQVGSAEPLKPAALNHSMTILTDAIAVANTFNKVDNSFTLNNFSALLDAASDQEFASLEKLTGKLRNLIRGDNPALPTGNNEREKLYAALGLVEDDITTLSNVGPQLPRRIRDLTAVSASTIASTATSGADALAYRYALKELNPFAITGLDYNSLHNSGDKQGALELFKPADGTGQLTEEYLKDRAEFLSGLIKANIQDAVSIRGANTNTNKLYVDVSANTVVTVKGQVLGFDSTEAAAQYRFGGTGNDTLTGNQTGGGDIEHEQGDRVIRNKACKAMQSKKRRTPIGGHRGTKKARTARGTETLRFDKSTAQRRTKYTAANNNQYVRAA